MLGMEAEKHFSSSDDEQSDYDSPLPASRRLVIRGDLDKNLQSPLSNSLGKGMVMEMANTPSSIAGERMNVNLIGKNSLKLPKMKNFEYNANDKQDFGSATDTVGRIARGNSDVKENYMYSNGESSFANDILLNEKKFNVNGKGNGFFGEKQLNWNVAKSGSGGSSGSSGSRLDSFLLSVKKDREQSLKRMGTPPKRIASRLLSLIPVDLRGKQPRLSTGDNSIGSSLSGLVIDLSTGKGKGKRQNGEGTFKHEVGKKFVAGEADGRASEHQKGSGEKGEDGIIAEAVKFSRRAIAPRIKQPSIYALNALLSTKIEEQKQKKKEMDGDRIASRSRVRFDIEKDSESNSESEEIEENICDDFYNNDRSSNFINHKKTIANDECKTFSKGFLSVKASNSKMHSDIDSSDEFGMEEDSSRFHPNLKGTQDIECINNEVSFVKPFIRKRLKTARLLLEDSSSQSEGDHDCLDRADRPKDSNDQTIPSNFSDNKALNKIDTDKEDEDNLNDLADLLDSDDYVPADFDCKDELDSITKKVNSSDKALTEGADESESKIKFGSQDLLDGKKRVKGTKAKALPFTLAKSFFELEAEDDDEDDEDEDDDDEEEEGRKSKSERKKRTKCFDQDKLEEGDGEAAIALELEKSEFFDDSPINDSDNLDYSALANKAALEAESRDINMLMSRFLPEKVLAQQGPLAALRKKYAVHAGLLADGEYEDFDLRKNGKDFERPVINPSTFSKFGQVRGVLPVEPSKSHPDFIKMLKDNFDSTSESDDTGNLESELEEDDADADEDEYEGEYEDEKDVINDHCDYSSEMEDHCTDDSSFKKDVRNKKDIIGKEYLKDSRGSSFDTAVIASLDSLGNVNFNPNGAHQLTAISADLSNGQVRRHSKPRSIALDKADLLKNLQMAQEAPDSLFSDRKECIGFSSNRKSSNGTNASSSATSAIFSTLITSRPVLKK